MLTPLRRRYVSVPKDLAGITHRSSQEASPRDLGLRDNAANAIWRSVERLFRTRTQPAISLCVRHRGQVVVERAIGFARGGGPGEGFDAKRVAATPETPFCIFSASKAVTAMLIHQLDAQNLLRLDDPVAEFIPEFARNGKERITIRHVLTHRAGIPSVAGHNDPELLLHWETVLGLLCDARPEWAPGRRLGYHAITGGYILGEIARRVTGKTVREILRDEVQRPMGFRWFNYGVPPEDVGSVALNAFTGLPVPPVLAQVVRRGLGVRFEEAARISNDPRFLTAIVPSGNVVATARELATFFELLLDGGGAHGVKVFDRRTVKRALTESSFLEVDLTLGVPIRYGLGLMLGTPVLSLYGPHTQHAFGHYGFINVIGWADPERNLSAALLTSGKPFLGTHLWRLWSVLGAIASNIPPS